MLWVFMHIIFAGVTSILLFELLSNHRNNPFVTTLYNTAYPISDIGFPGQFSVIQYQRWQAGGQAEQKCPSVRTDQFVYWSRSVRMDGRTDRRTNEWATVRVLEHGRNIRTVRGVRTIWALKHFICPYVWIAYWFRFFEKWTFINNYNIFMLQCLIYPNSTNYNFQRKKNCRDVQSIFRQYSSLYMPK